MRRVTSRGSRVRARNFRLLTGRVTGLAVTRRCISSLSAIPARCLTCWQPFPLNPSFKPPTPVGEHTKQLIYDHFMSNPAENHVRALAALHGLSIARVDAILRLKGLEEHWKKVSVLSMTTTAHFCASMMSTNRLVLKTIHTGFMVKQTYMHGFLNFYLFHRSLTIFTNYSFALGTVASKRW